MRTQHDPASCELCPVRHRTLCGFGQSLASEFAHLRTAIRIVGARKSIYREGERPKEFSTLFGGWAYRCKILSDGRRQILSFILPGDALSIRSLWVDRFESSVQALTNVSLCIFDKQKITEFLDSKPLFLWRIGELLACELGVMERRLLHVGRHAAQASVAWLLIDIYKRLRDRDRANGLSFAFPLRQQHIADALGLTAVHVNRVFQELRAAQLISREGDMLTILDYEGLADVADENDGGSATPMIASAKV
jgi:CRP/FNR family transcriptional regulator